MTSNLPPECERALALFDAANAADPNQETADGKTWPKERLYAERMTEMLTRFLPEATAVAHLACRAQHLCRWQIPRRDYPMTPEGYQRWRTTLYKFHADTAGELMRQAGCDEAMIDAVKQAVGKRGIKVNPESQTLEDVASLVFLEHYMLDFSGRKQDYSEEKWLGIIAKTWKKMSDAGRAFALSGQVRLPAPLLPLIQKAIG